MEHIKKKFDVEVTPTKAIPSLKSQQQNKLDTRIIEMEATL
jgi:hypothetical protein